MWFCELIGQESGGIWLSHCCVCTGFCMLCRFWPQRMLQLFRLPRCHWLFVYQLESFWHGWCQGQWSVEPFWCVWVAWDVIGVGGDVGFTHSPTLSSSLGEVHSSFSDWMPPSFVIAWISDCGWLCNSTLRPWPGRKAVARLAPYLSSRLPFLPKNLPITGCLLW